MDHSDHEVAVVTIKPGLVFTQTCFRVGARHFQLKRITELEAQQSGHDPLTRQAALLALFGVVMLVLLARYMHPAGLIITITVLIGLALLALYGAQRRPRRMELWARYDGEEIRIFVSDDVWIFTAVERQLRRCMTEIRMGSAAASRPGAATSAVPHPSMLHPSKMHPAGF
jgi:hypothetical protein